MPQLVIRETAKAQSEKNWALMRGLWRWSNFIVVISSGVGISIIIALNLFLDNSQNGRLITLTAGAMLIPLIALANIRAACLRGLSLVVWGQLPDTVLRPALFFLFCILWTNVVVEPALEPELAMALHVLAAAITFSVGWLILRAAQPSILKTKPTPQYHSKSWQSAIIPLALTAGLQIINNHADLIILGLFQTNEKVGIYRSSFQLALLVIFGLQAINQALQPHFARLYAEEKTNQLQRLIIISSRTIFAFALPPVLFLTLFGSQILSTIYGEPFRSGALSLAILALGQLFNAGIGSSGMLLNMTGYEKETMQGIMAGATANIVLNLILVPPFGMTGAAISTSLTLIFWNIILRRKIKQKLNLEITGFKSLKN